MENLQNEKTLFIIFSFLLFTFVLNASNEESFNQFEKFSTRLSLSNLPVHNIVMDDDGKDSYYV